MSNRERPLSLGKKERKRRKSLKHSYDMKIWEMKIIFLNGNRWQRNWKNFQLTKECSAKKKDEPWKYFLHDFYQERSVSMSTVRSGLKLSLKDLIRYFLIEQNNGDQSNRSIYLEENLIINGTDQDQSSLIKKETIDQNKTSWVDFIYSRILVKWELILKRSCSFFFSFVDNSTSSFIIVLNNP